MRVLYIFVESEFVPLDEIITPPPLAVLELALLVYDSLLELVAVVPVLDLCLSGSITKFINLYTSYLPCNLLILGNIYSDNASEYFRFFQCSLLFSKCS